MDFPPPRLYSTYFLKELDSNQMISNYTHCAGNPVLREAISTYEKLIGTDNMNFPGGFADNICVTAGATAALKFYFEYYSQKYPETAVLFLGLNYFAFYEYCNIYQLKKIVLTSKKKNRIAPTIEEITREIRKERPKLISLTLPLNPSGEIYSEDELRRLISVLKKYDMLFLIDKVQADVFAANFDYININKVIIEEQFVDKVVVIDSLSKTRGLPGARLGYIMADKEAIDYITYLNELCYYNPAIWLIDIFAVH
ncbi:pyridoxal phosphate-dependent aminotransferase [Acidobacteriota bacterium]